MERRLSAILAADVVGYSRLMGEDEAGTLDVLKAHRAELIDPKATQYGGRTIKLMGDGVLMEFASVVDAVGFAVDLQYALQSRNESLPATQQTLYRIGINIGDVIVDGDDIYGDGVNIAARLESLAKPGGICISSIVYESLGNRINIKFEDAGKHEAKNIAKPIWVYQWLPFAEGQSPTPSTDNSLIQSEVPSIAVLAFDNMSGDPEQEYFSEGISEDIITALSRFRELFVIARNSSFSYKGKSTRVQEIGRDLGVMYIVEGSVRRSGRRIRITVQLVSAANGNHIWADRFDRELEDVFDLQDEITQAIVTVLPLRLQVAKIESARQQPSRNLAAYDCFLRARWLYDRTSGRVPEVLGLLDTAIEIDACCAHAHAFSAFVYAYSVFSFFPLAVDPIASAKSRIECALGLADGDHQIHTIAAQVYIMSGKHDLAEINVKKALSLNPNDFAARMTQGTIESYSGNGAKGVKLITAALAHDPLAPDSQLEDLAEATYMARDYEGAITIIHRWQKPLAHTYTHLAACYAQLGRIALARKAVEKFEAECPDGYGFSKYVAAHIRMCKHRKDAEHWSEGYRKAGLFD